MRKQKTIFPKIYKIFTGKGTKNFLDSSHLIELESFQDKRLIDDLYINKYISDKEKHDNYMNMTINMFLKLVVAYRYTSLYQYSKSIAFDRHRKWRKMVLAYFFFGLNLAVISYDIYKLTRNFNSFYLASVIIRFIFVPLFSYYNIVYFLLYKSKDSSLSIVLYISSISTILIIIVIASCFKFNDFYQAKYRIANLEYVPIDDNYTIINKKMINHPVCSYEIFDVSPIDAFGYSLGGYDVKRNKTVFDNQMKIFFGENYSNHISYTINEIDEHFLFLKYYDSLIDTHIFAFRGYNSGPEIAFQLELLATHYIIPFFEDIVPFYEVINRYWLNVYTNFLISFGLNFFENVNLMVKYVNSIINIYEKYNFTDDERVLFAGINCGGAIAKIVGTSLQRKSISFISFAIDNNLFNLMFGFSLPFVSLVTNVYNVEGFFSDQEPRYATNIGINIPVFDKKKFCTSGICDINSKTDNVYRTFCTISEICGKGNRFNYFCENIIGKDDVETIRMSLKNENI